MPCATQLQDAINDKTELLPRVVDTAIDEEESLTKTIPLNSGLSRMATEEVDGSPAATNTDVLPTEVTSHEPPVSSALPTEDPEFRELVVEFVGHLVDQLTAIDNAFE